MAYQIASFFCQRTPTNQFQTIQGGANDFIFAEEKNVLIKKIASKCIYQGSSDVVVTNYSLVLELLNKDRIPLLSERLIINNITGFRSSIPQFLELNKNNPVLDLNIVCGGFRLPLDTSYTSSFSLNSGVINPSDLIIYQISIYYEKVK